MCGDSIRLLQVADIRHRTRNYLRSLQLQMHQNMGMAQTFGPSPSQGYEWRQNVPLAHLRLKIATRQLPFVLSSYCSPQVRRPPRDKRFNHVSVVSGSPASNPYCVAATSASTTAAVAWGSGTVSPSSRIPSMWNSIASRISSSSSSREFAVATQPGRSGTKAA